MIYTLVLITAAGVQQLGMYDNPQQCSAAAREWQQQGIKAGCVQQPSPAEIMQQMTGLLVKMQKELDK
jgi:hypothetical protein